MKTPAPIITTSFQFAQVFTQENQLKYDQQKFFGDPDWPGLKAIEAFDADIKTNLISWTCVAKCIYYRTKKYWYMYEKQKVKTAHRRTADIIAMTRFSLRSWTRWDTWMNVHSCSVGKKWLTKATQYSKKTTLFSS